MLLLILFILNLNINIFGLAHGSSFDYNDQQTQNTTPPQLHDHVIGNQKVDDYHLVKDGRNLRNRRGLSSEEKSSTISNVNFTMPLLPVFLPSFAEYSSQSFLKHLPQSPDLMHHTGQIANKRALQLKAGLIPRLIWVAVKNKHDALPTHLLSFFSRNPSWSVNICDNECKDHFMGPSGPFAGTSVSWAYFLINPLTGAAKADMWRYSVLYAYGGVYIDDDSDIATELDEVR